MSTDDYRFIHFGWSDDTCCGVKRGRVIDRESKGPLRDTYLYCYECKKRKKEVADGNEG